MKLYDQYPSSTTEIQIVKSIKRFKTASNCYYIGDRKKQLYMYKYMDIETAIKCLKGRNIMFVEPILWPDKYESRFYTANYSKIVKDFNNITPKLYACCFTFSRASEAAWKTYSYEKTGLASRCVQFRINKRLFREALNRFAKENQCKIYEGPIDYSLTDFQINNVHLPSSGMLYDQVFKVNFKLNNYLSLLLIKRQAFNYENEYRYFIVPNNGVADENIFPIIPWSDIIVEVKVDKECSDIEIEILSKYLQESGVKLKPTRFDLYSNPDDKITIEKEEE